MCIGRAGQHFWLFQPANTTSTWLQFTLPQLAISVIKEKKYNSQWQILF
jgi:hypothetical protein